MRQIIKRLFRKAGLRLEQWRPPNRFNAMEETLEMLRLREFRPAVIVDAGANIGDWTRMALRVFPESAVHVIEPQPACRARLEALVRERRSVIFHPIALSEPGRTRLAFTGGVADGCTGVHVMTAAESDLELECAATTLDDLLAGRIRRADRALLKLDLEGHDLPALRGARKLLDLVEVVVVETQLYDINNSGVIPIFHDVYDFLAGRGFELYDFATLGWRKRDMRMHMMDVVFARSDGALCADRAGR